MKEILMKDKEEKKLVKVAAGSEGIIYEYNDEIYKRFYDVEPRIIANKTKKIEKIDNLNIDFLVKANNIVLDKRMNPKGYTMEKINYDHTMYWCLKDDRMSLNTKISYLKQLQEKVKTLHKQGITVGDFNMANFLFENRTDNLKFIDIDNYGIDGLKSDIKPDVLQPYYDNKINDGNDENFDKFSFAIMAIRLLTPQEKNRFEWEMLRLKNGFDRDYLKDVLIPGLDVDKQVKEYLYHIISNDKQKEYFNDLDKLKTKDSFLRMK